MKDRALPFLILRGPIALGKRNTGSGLKSFLTLGKFLFFFVTFAVVYEKLCKSSIRLKVINCFALSRFLSDQCSRRMSVRL